MREARSFAPQYASAGHRDETAELGMWVFIATEVLLFGGLLLGYVVYRHAFSEAFSIGSERTDILIGTANTAILLTSSFLVACAVDAFKSGARVVCIALLSGATLLGFVFLGLKGVEYASEYREHLVPGIDFRFEARLAGGVQLFFLFYFIATAIHAVHMMIGIGLLAALAGLIHVSPSSRHGAALHAAGLYWHFVDVVWIVLFALIYLPGRSVT